MKLDMKKWNPWNWFRHEDKEEEKSLPVSHSKDNGTNNDYYPTALLNHPLMSIHREIDRIFEDAFSRTGMGLSRLNGHQSPLGLLSQSMLKPSVDIKETKNSYQITVEVPGVDEKEVSVEVYGDALIISGEKTREKEEKDDRYHSIERSYGSFRRVLALPVDADGDSIDATFKNGVITISVSRIAGKNENGVKQIPVRTASSE